MTINEINQYILNKFEDIKALDPSNEASILVEVSDNEYQDIITYLQSNLSSQDDTDKNVILTGMCANYIKGYCAEKYYADDVTIAVSGTTIEFFLNGDPEGCIHYHPDKENRISFNIFDKAIEYIKFDLKRKAMFIDRRCKEKYSEWNDLTELMEIVENLFDETIPHSYSDKEIFDILYQELKYDMEFCDPVIKMTMKRNKISPGKYGITINFKYRNLSWMRDLSLRFEYLYGHDITVYVDDAPKMVLNQKSGDTNIDGIRKFLGEIIENLSEEESVANGYAMFNRLCKSHNLQMKKN